MSDGSYAGDVTSAEAFEILVQDGDAVLVDVRTTPEWQFVGVPDLRGIGKETVFLCWQAYPQMAVHPDFAGALRAQEPPPQKPPTQKQGEQEPKQEPDPLTKRIKKAIADYEKVRRDKKKLAQRRRLLGWLGEIDDPRVDKYLRKELKAFARYGSGKFVVEAIDKIDRPSFEKDLLRTLSGGKTVPGLTGACCSRNLPSKIKF